MIAGAGILGAEALAKIEAAKRTADAIAAGEPVCRSCGESDSFRAWYPVDEGQTITPPVIVDGELEFEYDGDTKSGESGETDEFWCDNCSDSAKTLEELVGLAPPAPTPAAPYQPLIVITRHPDFPDDIRSFGECTPTVYLDLGASLDVTKLGPDDEEAVRDLIASAQEQVRNLPDSHPGKQHVLYELNELWDSFVDQNGNGFETPEGL